ncbi:MAG: ComEC/Rec2 family competence protein, partial [Bacilli bacterium]
MKKILSSNYFYYILIVFILIYVSIFSIIFKNSSYEEKKYIIIGRVIRLKKEENKTSFVIKSKEKIKCYIYNDVNFNEGDTIKIEVKLSKPSNNTIPNTFNYKKYLYHNYIHYVGKVNNYEVINKNKNIFINFKQKITYYVSFNKYLKLFFIGDRSSLNDSYENFQDIGVAHLLAISGMHVGIFITILRKILFFLSKNNKNLIISLILIFYSFIVGFTASIMRATLFFILDSILNYFNI